MSRTLASISEVPVLFPPGEPVDWSPVRPGVISVAVVRAVRRMKRRASTCLMCERMFCPGCAETGH